MVLRNFWLNKVNEKTLFKVVEWAHRNKRPVEELTKEEIYFAIKTYLRDPSHA